MLCPFCRALWSWQRTHRRRTILHAGKPHAQFMGTTSGRNTQGFWLPGDMVFPSRSCTHRQGLEAAIHQVIAASTKEDLPHHHVNATLSCQPQLVQPPAGNRPQVTLGLSMRAAPVLPLPLTWSRPHMCWIAGGLPRHTLSWSHPAIPSYRELLLPQSVWRGKGNRR